MMTTTHEFEGSSGPWQRGKRCVHKIHGGSRSTDLICIRPGESCGGHRCALHRSSQPQKALPKWLSDEILQRLPPFPESSWQHICPQIPYVGPAHSHLSSLCPTTPSIRSAHTCCCRTRGLRANGALSEDRCGICC